MARQDAGSLSKTLRQCSLKDRESAVIGDTGRCGRCLSSGPPPGLQRDNGLQGPEQGGTGPQHRLRRMHVAWLLDGGGGLLPAEGLEFVSEADSHPGVCVEFPQPCGPELDPKTSLCSALVARSLVSAASADLPNQIDFRPERDNRSHAVSH